MTERTTLHRRQINQLLAAAPLLAATPFALAQQRRDSVVLGMVLEPPGLDPTIAPAAAIGEIVHYNILEGLTKIQMDGAVTPLLAEAWTHTPDGKTYSFGLRKGVRFSDGSPFDANAVKFSFERAKAPGSTNKAKKALWDNISSVHVQDAHTVILVLDKADASLPFRLGENTAVILHPNSAANAATKPVGTGPFVLDNWAKGSAVTLAKWDGHRNAEKVRLKKATFRFINDPAAQVAALLAGDIDGMPRFGALQALRQFQADKRFTVEIGSTAGKGIVAINNRKAPFNDLRVRRAFSHAIDRKAFIDGAQEGLGTPIGSHFAPTDLGYIDLTKTYPYDPEKAKTLLRDAGVTTPLNVTLTLPPPQYARKGGEIIAAQLAKVGVVAKIENVEWAQWLDAVYRKKNYDMSIVLHVEPFDLDNFTRENYYWGYRSPTFDALYAKMRSTADDAGRAKLLGDIQRLLAEDSPLVFLYQPQLITIANAKVKGLWKDVPIFANDLSALSWQ